MLNAYSFEKSGLVMYIYDFDTTAIQSTFKQVI